MQAHVAVRGVREPELGDAGVVGLWSQRGGAIENRTFAIDPAGRLSAEQATSPAAFQIGALDLPAAATSTALASMTAARTSYALDGRNNWTSRTSAGVTTSYAQDARDALLAIGSQAVATEALGAITDDGTHRYTYDALGLVAEVRPLGTSGGRRYQRDALGRVVAETDLASGAVTRFAWDGAQRVFVQRPTAAVETTLAAEGLDQPVVTIFPGGARRYFHQDRQGSVYAQDRRGTPSSGSSHSVAATWVAPRRSVTDPSGLVVHVGRPAASLCISTSTGEGPVASRATLRTVPVAVS